MKGFRTRRLTFTLILLLALLAAGCGESGLLDLYNLEGEVEISTLPAGSVIAAGETIPVSVRTAEDSESVEELELTLYSREGERLGGWNLPADGDPAQLETQNLAPGYYQLTIRALGSSGRDLEERELPFFISDGVTRIRGISAYPSAALPKEGMVFFADLDIAPGSDPYLRWSAAGRPIGAGTVSEGMRLVSWKVPESEGVYPVTVELFPFPPPGTRGFAFQAADQFRIEAFVSTDPREARGEFGPAAEYPLLFHFRGSFASAGSLTVAEPRQTGEPQLAVESGTFGYRFGSGDELVYRVPALLALRDGAAATTLQLKGIFDGTGTVFALDTPRGERYLALERVDTGFLLRFGETVTELSLPGELLNQPRYLAVRFTRRPVGYALAWFLDGEFRAGRMLTMLPPAASEASVLHIGPDFSGLLDEIGVHRGDDPGIFAFAMRERYGRLLILAEGFDAGEGSRLSDRTEVALRRDPDNSRLILPPGAEAGIALPLDDYSDGRVTLRFSDPAEAPSLYIAAGEQRFPIDGLVPDLSGRISLGWRRDEGRVEFIAGDGSVGTGFERGAEENVELRIAAQDGPLSLEWIVITRGEASIVSGENGEQEPEA